jgi:hypothetical protein
MAGGGHSFPAALTSFAGPGRAGPVREVAGLLEDYRLVMVTRLGGWRQIRLTGEGRAVCRFADRVWLAAAQDPVRAACGGCRGGRGVLAARAGPV